MFSDSAFLAAAEAIGRRIVADAVWENGRCSWVGAEQVRPWRIEYRAVGPGLHQGSAGIGLFLAHLAAVTGEANVRRTAVGALRHAVGRAAPRDGFYSGSAGIAWAAAQVASLLGEDALRAGSATVLARAGPPTGGSRAADIVEGAAGAVVGRLALGDVQRAVADGEALLRQATVDAHGWSWRSADPRHRRPLCGLAHGVAGIGWALLALFDATGDSRFRTAAEGAFAYERSWIDPREGTWPDHRLSGYRRGRPHPFPSPALGTWCHGEAGIALSRLRAEPVLGSQEDLAHALAATRRRLEDALSDDLGDLSLCHGLTGAAEVLLCAGDGPDTVDAVAGEAIERHAARDDWPCAEGPASAPGLFPGLAGIGWFYLRLHDPGIASPLALDPVPANA